MRVDLEKTVDVERVERTFAELWLESAGRDDEAAPVLRARVSNLLVFVGNHEQLEEVEQLMPELTQKHPSRALIMLGERDAPDVDIELDVVTHCQDDIGGGIKRLSCERATLKAYGRFVPELPSAALPLLVSDLSTFLWWRERTDSSDVVFNDLIESSDRLIIDSDDFEEPSELKQVDALYKLDECEGVGISDLNWARLTYWRELLADFYDVPAYQDALHQLQKVTIDYVPQSDISSVATQPFLLTAWLASRLGWTFVEQKKDLIVFLDRNGNSIEVHLNSVHPAGRKPGRLVKVELITNNQSTFSVARSDDNLHLLTAATTGSETRHGRVLPVRNRSTAQLLSRELEILCNDDIYREAVEVAAKIV